jgi:hypothetical protein
MKNYLMLFVMLFVLQSYAQKDHTIFEIKPQQSMLMTGKGSGQDGAINPYKDGNSIAIVENIGEHTFSIRVQYKGKIFREIELTPGNTTKVPLKKGSELYFDTKKLTKVKLEFMDGLN